MSKRSDLRAELDLTADQRDLMADTLEQILAVYDNADSGEWLAELDHVLGVSLRRALGCKGRIPASQRKRVAAEFDAWVRRALVAEAKLAGPAR